MNLSLLIALTANTIHFARFGCNVFCRNQPKPSRRIAWLLEEIVAVSLVGHLGKNQRVRAMPSATKVVLPQSIVGEAIVTHSCVRI
jgi:hypothetical protein